MKITKFNLNQAMRFASFAIAVAILGLLSSCDSDSGNKPAPTVKVDNAELSNTPGQTVTAKITIDAPEGAKTLSTLVNGAPDAAFPDKSLSGTSTTSDFSYTIPVSASVGTVVNFSFQATDNKGQKSTSVLVKVAASAKQVVQVTADITSDVTWTSDKIYVLNGFRRVGEDIKPGTGGPGVAPVITTAKKATLTIQPGTVILGKKGTPGGALIIQRGSKLIANGTAAAPIVFTSDQPIGNRSPGDWAGVIICGQAPNNLRSSTSTGTDGIEELEGAYGGFHGGGASPINDDNSGSLKYVRIEYAGYPINPNQEINGLTLGSVGSGTTLDFIQVTYANDDSYEWFGGTVNAKHLIALKGIDDDFDTDNGFSGKVQFGLGIRAAAIADQSGSNGFESDNDAAGSSNTPFTSAEFSNMTIVGGKATSGTTIDIQFQNGAQIRRNAKQKIYNSVITGYPNGIYIDNTLPGGANFATIGAIANANAGDIAFKNNILAGVDGWGGNGFGSVSTADEITALGTTAGSAHPNPPRGRAVAGGVGSFANGVFGYSTVVAGTNTGEQQIGGAAPVAWFGSNNKLFAKWTSTGLNANIFDPLTAPTLVGAGELLTGASFTGLTGFDSTPAYRGAFGTTDWTTGWANWNPSVTDYSK
jgi:hypothetical protein